MRCSSFRDLAPTSGAYESRTGAGGLAGCSWPPDDRDRGSESGSHQLPDLVISARSRGVCGTPRLHDDRAARAARRRCLLDRDVHALGHRCRSRRTPIVLKLTADPPSSARGAQGSSACALSAARGPGRRRSPSAHVVCPSSYMVELAISWGAAPEDVTLLRTRRPASTMSNQAPRGSPGARSRADGAKDLGLRSQRCPRCRRPVSRSSATAGPGPRLEHLRDELALGDRVRFLGSRSRAEALASMRAADVVILSSAWENFRTVSWRRWQSVRRSSRRALAECRRSSSTAKTVARRER